MHNAAHTHTHVQCVRIYLSFNDSPERLVRKKLEKKSAEKVDYRGVTAPKIKYNIRPETDWGQGKTGHSN